MSTEIIQAEYQRDLVCMGNSDDSMIMRDYQIASSAHDALSAHHDRIFEEMNLFLSGFFGELDWALVVTELKVGSPIHAILAMVLPNTENFDINRVMVLGVWGSHTRPLLPSEDTRPSCWKSRRDSIGAMTRRHWGDWRVASVARISLDSTPCHICAKMPVYQTLSDMLG